MKLTVRRKEFIGIALLLFVATVYILLTGQTKLLIVFPCVFFLAGILYCVHSFCENIFLFCFLICFFTFLLGGQVINRIVQVYGYDFSDEIEMHTDIVLAVSLAGLLLGYFLCDGVREKRRTYLAPVDYNSSYYVNIRYLGRTLFYLTYPFWVIVLLDNILYVMQYGYTAYYLSFSNRLPAIIRQIGYMAPMCLFVFLATMPRKKEATLPLILYMLYMVLSLGTGRRVYFMTAILFVFAYFVLRNVVNPGEKPWVGKKGIIALIIFVPVLLALMYLYEYVRSDQYVGTASSYFPLVGFFVRQGTSVNVIKYAELFKEQLNPDAHYSLYNLIKFLQGDDSFISDLFSLNFNFEIGRQTELTATQGTSLADFVSYHANKASYLNGQGYGSCYVEELYVDYGYFGVFVGNMLYGVLLCSLLKGAIKKHNIWLIALGFYITDLLFKAPRATFDAFLGQSLYFKCWGTMLLIYFVASRYRRDSFGENRLGSVQSQV